MAFISEKLNDKKRQYFIYDLEFYAIFHTIYNWKDYLNYWEFVIYLDHDALHYFHSLKKKLSSYNHISKNMTKK